MLFTNLEKTAPFRSLINGLIFEIMNIENNQSLEFELKTNVNTT